MLKGKRRQPQIHRSRKHHLQLISVPFTNQKKKQKKKNLEPRVVNLIIVELCGRECVSFAISISADPWYALVFSSCASFPVHSVSMLIVLVLAQPKKGEERKKKQLADVRTHPEQSGAIMG